jgi:hypothetical protein
MKDTKPAPEALEIGIDGECPICAKNPPFNAVTIAAIREGEAMLRGEIPTKWYCTGEKVMFHRTGTHSDLL